MKANAILFATAFVLALSATQVSAGGSRVSFALATPLYSGLSYCTKVGSSCIFFGF